MAIRFDGKNKVFYLETPNTSYVFGVVQDKYLMHLHYGRKLRDFSVNIEEYAKMFGENYSVVDADTDNIYGDALPVEFSTYGSADLRTPTFHAQYENGTTVTKLYYNSYKIYKGKPKLNGLPATYVENDDEATTLEIELIDSVTKLEATLIYTVFENHDAITRSVRYNNNGDSVIHLKSVLSASVDFNNYDYDFISLPGSWARERHIEKMPLGHNTISFSSNKGTTSHVQNNFFALAGKSATETEGEVYGFSLVYSGNFTAGVDVSSQDIARAYIGISPFNFDWKLESDGEFQTPEVVMVYSAEGMGKMSRTYHKLYRTRLCRGKYRDQERPVLINNWEATYFDFDEDKIVNIAKKAKEAGIDLMVLDDGWFGKRNNDLTSLGDWFEDVNKLPKGLGSLAEKITELGMKFGIWFEPEMISVDSDLFRAHPDWHLHQEGRNPSFGRHQLVLDLSRQEVCDYIVDTVCGVLKRANISYVKWDMNRYLSEIGSASYPADQQGEIAHRFVLGVYQIMERITSANPDVLFEGCSGGGGRFDPGILYYSPQIWTSDDTDAIERMYIQHGTSLVYPAMAMGAHVSAVPNHQLGRVTPIKLRGDVAMAGQFGYELDLNRLSDEEFEEVKQQVAFYKSIRETVHQGEMYRLCSPFDNSKRNTAWQYISASGEQIVVFDYTMLGKANSVVEHLKLTGLDANDTFVDAKTGIEYGADYLTEVGLPVRHRHDYDSAVYVLNKNKLFPNFKFS